MSTRQTFLAAVLVLYSGRTALPSTFAIAKKPPSVLVKDDAGNVTDRIAVPNTPDDLIYSKTANIVYVFHDADDGSAISVVNPARHRIDREILVRSTKSPGRAEGLHFKLILSNDGRRLFCYTAFMSSLNVAQLDVKPEFQPSVMVIDVSSNEVVATYSGWADGLRAVVPKAWASQDSFFPNDDGSLLLALFQPFTRFPNPIRQEQLSIFSGAVPHATFSMDTGGQVIKAMLSQDQKFLFAAVDKDPKSPGVVEVADLRAGTTVTRNLADHPRSLLRLGPKQGVWVLGDREMRSVSETGELGDRPIQLNKLRKSEGGDTDSADAFLDGYPGETITLGDARAAILITDQNGASRHRVALLDLAQLRVDAIVATMSAAEIAKIHTGNFLKAMAANVVAGAISGAIGGAYGTPAFGTSPLLVPGATFLPGGLANEALAARPDGKFLYALDTDIHAITVIDVDAATVLMRIPVDRSAGQLQVSPDGKDLLCIGKATEKVDMSQNVLRQDQKETQQVATLTAPKSAPPAVDRGPSSGDSMKQAEQPVAKLPVSFDLISDSAVAVADTGLILVLKHMGFAPITAELFVISRTPSDAEPLGRSRTIARWPMGISRGSRRRLSPATGVLRTWMRMRFLAS